MTTSRILFLISFLFIYNFVYCQKQNSLNDLVSCNIQFKVPNQTDSTIQVWNLVNSFTTQWNTALELQPNRNLQDTWNLNPWTGNQMNLPQSTSLPFIFHFATQTRSNLFQGILEARDKVCVYLKQ